MRRHHIPTYRLAIVLAALFVCVLRVQAQQAVAFAHYWQMEGQFNPAAVGRTDALNIVAAIQTHAAGYEDGGSTMFASADMAFTLGATRHGVGAYFENDEIGLFSHQRFAVQYAYHHRLFGGRISVGAELDMLNESVKGSKADLEDGSDPAFPTTDINGSKFDFGVGLFYARKAWYVGLGARQVASPTVLLGETNEISIKPLYNFTAGYNFRTHIPFLYIVPSTLLRFDGHNFRADITARVLMERDKKRLYGGVTYAPGHSVTGFVGGSFHGIDLSYSYEANTSGMGLGAGQHEVTIGYKLPLDLGKKGRNLHRSVRWL